MLRNSLAFRYESAALIYLIIEAEFFSETAICIYQNKHITSQVTVTFIISTRVTSNFTKISLQICTNILQKIHSKSALIFYKKFQSKSALIFYKNLTPNLH